MSRRWPALQLAQLRDARARVPFAIEDAGRAVCVGSVARSHLAALASQADVLSISKTGVLLKVPANERDAALAELNAWLRTAGLIVGWRDEIYPVLAHVGAPPVARIERAAARFFGLLTLAAHCNGYVADAHGRPTQLWIARRAAHKATDPGRLDNLIGGGVPHGQSPFEALLREGFEEAGLDASLVASAVAGPLIELHRDLPEGLQHEIVFEHELLLPGGLTPCNQDGEVSEFLCLPIEEALLRAASGEMTVDAELVTLAFALHHRLIELPLAGKLAPALAALTLAGVRPSCRSRRHYR